MTGVGCLLEAAFLIVYGLACTPAQAAAVFGAIDIAAQLHGSGGWTSFMEIGGPDAAVINSVSNSVANGFGFIVPHMGLYMRRATGSWLPHLVFGAVLKALSGLYFMRCASDRTARELLEESRA